MTLGRKTGGRRLGTPNKATSSARTALTLLLDKNNHKLSIWLDSVANGIRKIDPVTGSETNEFLVKPNPAKAFSLFQSILEFHVPKLTRVQFAEIDNDLVSANSNLTIFKELIKQIKTQSK